MIQQLLLRNARLNRILEAFILLETLLAIEPLSFPRGFQKLAEYHDVFLQSMGYPDHNIVVDAELLQCGEGDPVWGIASGISHRIFLHPNQ